MYKCSRCKKLFTRDGVSKYSKSAKGKSYFKCRKCNCEKSILYRATARGRMKTYEAIYRSIKKYRYKQRARNILYYHVAAGHIKRGICKCGNKKTEGHHKDYSKPLSVLWVCRLCHSILHRKK